MRILIINRFFWPDESSTAMLAADIAEDLVGAGHEVEVACARLLYDRPDAQLPERETWRGVRIHRFASTRFGRGTLPGRFADLVSFHGMLCLRGPLRFRPDVLLVMTDPAMILLDALWLARLRRAKVVHHVMDLYPDIAGALGAIAKGGWVERGLARLMGGLLRRCDKVIALGDCMAERLIRYGVPPDRIAVIPPWAQNLDSGSGGLTNELRASLGMGGKDFLVMYSGNMGKAHPFDAVMDAAELLKDDTAIHFLFVGGGARASQIRSAAEQRGLERFRMLPYQPRERLGVTLGAADLHLITQEPGTEGMIVPSKLAGILAVGRPVLFVGEARSDIGHALDRHKCGMVVSPTSGRELADVVRELKGDRVRLEQMAERARSAFQQDYSREVAIAKILGICAEVGTS